MAGSIQPLIGVEIRWPQTIPVQTVLAQMKLLEREEPTLHVRWQEQLGQLHLDCMGSVQLEVLEEMIEGRFGWRPVFQTPEVLYRETITTAVRGIGHYEPLRHYAEVHLLLEPGEPGSGVVFRSRCHTDTLALNWQRLIETHVLEKDHVGAMIGAPITDVVITLLAGRSHLKHTEGGDFRQATYRAIRQGLFQAECQLLEPTYRFRAEVEPALVGRIVSDVQKMHGNAESPVLQGAVAVVEGSCPVVQMMDYAAEFSAITRGLGQLSLEFGGYAPCHNTQAVLERRRYDRERDVENPADSVFCSHGAGFTVKWQDVPAHAHISV